LLFRILARRAASALVTLAATSVLVFATLDVLPGNAAAILLGTGARPDTVAALQHQLGLDRPAPLRYLGWIGGLVTGDLGQSATYGVPVGQLVAERLAVTLPLGLLALLFACMAGIGLGTIAAGAARRWPDRAVAGFAQLGIAVPDFWIGLLLILLLASTLHWTSAGGFPGWGDPLAGLKALLLPALALALPQAAVLSRTTRAALLEVLGEGFIRTARAKGAGPARVLLRHGLPAAMAPVLTVVGLQMSFLVAGAVLVEVVFNLPGLGRLAAQALAQRDLVVMRSVAMLFAGSVIAINTLVDLAQPWLDPRLRAP
jgi:peptide/nickel transport system permease protein